VDIRNALTKNPHTVPQPIDGGLGIGSVHHGSMFCLVEQEGEVVDLLLRGEKLLVKLPLDTIVVLLGLG